MGSFSIWHWLIVLSSFCWFSVPRSCATSAATSAAREELQGLDGGREETNPPNCRARRNHCTTIEGEVKDKQQS